jgi:hypothetical protein
MVDLVALKDLMQPVFPLLGVVVGAIMTGSGQLYKARQEKRRVIALALSDLLEVRHRVVTFNELLKYIQTQGKVPAVAMPHLRNLFDQLFPLDAKLDARFDEAVTLLAGMDPVFAFDLRSKNLLPHLMNKMRVLAASTNQDLAGYEGAEGKMIDVVAPTLDEAVLSVAKQHSWRVYRQVKSVISAKDRVGEQMSPLLASLGIESAAPA